ncbi:transcription factor jumonji jmjC domain protein [Janthinobacterium agaricidamnosum NBRC 102515 = DSM 9628]|uniref:Transcription factor jumonji jmjC domain protein n=2 Tax=Janthinobacterium agaricidamnosum TaxID=55508 RepID=W0V5I2_9BURK|nr:cupin-like domain-containing protein [Janthinobacterium agaricidamnosum]CDG84084.1 transcription factor jumonji jmjC domain protein [Janthinobacterium agaricidamnosum NBRC 102515 = DSM 9628]
MDRMRALPTAQSTDLSDQWRGWIAENLILGTAPGSLIPILMQSGISEHVATLEVALALKSPYLQGANRLKNRLLKRDWVLGIQCKLNRLRAPQIERRHQLTAQEFLDEYYSINQPVIITGMMEDWPARQKWSADYFRGKFSEREVEVQFGRNADDNYELNSIAHKRKMAFGDYVELVQNSGKTNDFYMTANNDSLNRRALTELWDDIGQLPEYLKPDGQARGFLWYGPAGTVTPFHHDLTNNFMAQVSGRKRLRIIPACETANVANHRHCFTQVDGRNIDLQRFPQMANVQVLECVLEPGEILFLPVGCWHFVEGLDISVTVAFTNFKWDNDFYTMYPSHHDF